MKCTVKAEQLAPYEFLFKKNPVSAVLVCNENKLRLTFPDGVTDWELAWDATDVTTGSVKLSGSILVVLGQASRKVGEVRFECLERKLSIISATYRASLPINR